MADAKTCPKCRGGMTEGFVIDQSYGGRAVSSWVEGAPHRSMWLGVSLAGGTPIEIATWRCERCGFLESYA